MAETSPSPDLIAGLYSAGLGLVSWERSLTQICEATGADHAIVQGTHAFPFIHSARVDNAVLLSSVNAMAALAYDGPDMSPLQPGDVASRSRFMADPAFAATACYNEVVRPMGGFHALYGIGVQGAQGATVLLCRRRDQHDFGADQANLLSTLLPHFSAAISLGVRRSEQPAPADILNVFDSAAIVCDPSGRVAMANAAALRVLEGDGGLLLVRGLLAGRNPGDTTRLRRAVEAVAGRGEPSVTLRLCRDVGRLALLVRVVRVGLGGFGQPSLAAVLVSDPEAPRGVDRLALLEAYGLSPREADVAARLASGHSVGEIATATGLQVDSVRTYLKRIFAKTGVGSQAALVVLVHSFD